MPVLQDPGHVEWVGSVFIAINYVVYLKHQVYTNLPAYGEILWGGISCSF